MIKACSMQFIRNDAIEAAFITMMNNKLLYGHRDNPASPFDALRSANDTGAFHKVAELESRDGRSAGTEPGIDRADDEGLSGTRPFQQGKECAGNGA